MDESALLDLLECPVCLERLDASAKVLPCQHTFCKRCLLGIVGSRNELRCPECRTLVGSGVEELPSNILLVRLLDGIKQRPWKPGPGGGSGTNCTNALRAQSSIAANCSSKDLQSSQGGQQPRVQAWSPPVRGQLLSGGTCVLTALAVLTVVVLKGQMKLSDSRPGNQTFFSLVDGGVWFGGHFDIEHEEQTEVGVWMSSWCDEVKGASQSHRGHQTLISSEKLQGCRRNLQSNCQIIWELRCKAEQKSKDRGKKSSKYVAFPILTDSRTPTLMDRILYAKRERWKELCFSERYVVVTKILPLYKVGRFKTFLIGAILAESDPHMVVKRPKFHMEEGARTVTNLALPNPPRWDAPSEEPVFSSNWDEDTAFSGVFRSTKCTGLTDLYSAIGLAAESMESFFGTLLPTE
ncbi:hypothetical protein PANDA_006632 [Ailuropoda melanoleuca]|uniref:RING-type domain-containing protein n=1 Tax=Ailuropoda melanoleuca TaxID=9646 RepID=D2H8P9_AILME|nr:hypothetical protein PANDA_006632 [Ailuropoda melanoleuca]